jgi:hypothetical protein
MYVQLFCSVLFVLAKKIAPSAVVCNATNLVVFLLVTTRAVFFQLWEIILLFPKDRMHISDKHWTYLAYKAELRLNSILVTCIVQEVPQQDDHYLTTCSWDHFISKIHINMVPVCKQFVKKMKMSILLYL